MITDGQNHRGLAVGAHYATPCYMQPMAIRRHVTASLFPGEQARIVRLMVQRVSVSPAGIAVDLRTEGLGSVIHEMIAPRTEETIA